MHISQQTCLDITKITKRMNLQNPENTKFITIISIIIVNRNTTYMKAIAPDAIECQIQGVFRFRQQCNSPFTDCLLRVIRSRLRQCLTFGTQLIDLQTDTTDNTSCMGYWALMVKKLHDKTILTVQLRLTFQWHQNTTILLLYFHYNTTQQHKTSARDVY